MFAFQIKYGENRQLKASNFVSIGLVQTIWTELLKVKRRFWRFSKQGFTLLALFFQRKEVISSSAIRGGRPTEILPEQVQILVHWKFLSSFFFPFVSTFSPFVFRFANGKVLAS